MLKFGGQFRQTCFFGFAFAFAFFRVWASQVESFFFPFWFDQDQHFCFFRNRRTGPSQHTNKAATKKQKRTNSNRQHKQRTQKPRRDPSKSEVWFCYKPHHRNIGSRVPPESSCHCTTRGFLLFLFFSPQGGGEVSFLVSNKIVMLLLWSPITTAGIHRKRHRVVHAPIFFVWVFLLLPKKDHTAPQRGGGHFSLSKTQIYIAFRINTETNMKYKSDDWK